MIIYQVVQSKSVLHNPSNTAFSKKKKKIEELADENTLNEGQDFDERIERQERSYKNSTDL